MSSERQEATGTNDRQKQKYENYKRRVKLLYFDVPKVFPPSSHVFPHLVPNILLMSNLTKLEVE